MSPAATPAKQSARHALVGRRVQKLFGGVAYKGTVDSYYPAKRWFLIHYDDGDSEDITLHDLRTILVSDQPHQPSPKKGVASAPKNEPPPPLPPSAPAQANSSGKRKADTLEKPQLNAKTTPPPTLKPQAPAAPSRSTPAKPDANAASAAPAEAGPSTTAAARKVTAPAAVSAALSEYELKRQEQIQRNMERMRQLGIVSTVQAMTPTTPVTPQASRRPTLVSRAQRDSSRTPSRSSGRLKHVPVKDYAEGIDERRVAPRAKKDPYDNRKHPIFGALRIEHTNFPEQTAVETAHDEAKAAAEAATKKYGAPSFIKIMLPSMVDGGFWCEGPIGIVNHMPKGRPGSKHVLYLEMAGEEMRRGQALKVSTSKHGEEAVKLLPPTTDGRALKGEEVRSLPDGGARWPVVWLVRAASQYSGGMASGGFSGGWRGFAIDQRICVGDAICCTPLPSTYVDPAPAQGGESWPVDPGAKRVRISIHRARNPCTDLEKWS
ncbi:hypothetical protein RI054_31g122370 [Pseudoscourfieldia marina]